ncbi:hypothetical protein [Streptomyces sp. NPDC097619]|uniref:hypothetical protein n=1 Tax=Streptomyces sp. NPDC097619 TaxID=3157228 RepID=UPI003318AE37
MSRLSQAVNVIALCAVLVACGGPAGSGPVGGGPGSGAPASATRTHPGEVPSGPGRPSGSPALTPEAATIAYVVAARTVTAADAGAPHHRADRYLSPESPDLGKGLQVRDAPPVGATRRPVDVRLEDAGSAEDKVMFRVTYTPVSTAADGTLTRGPREHLYVTAAYQPSGAWLVHSESSTPPPTP